MADVPARREEADLPAPRQGFAGFQMTGKDLALWQEFRPQLIAAVKQILEQLVEEDTALNWLREQFKEFPTLALEYAKAKLRREGAEVEKIEAEVAKIYAERNLAIAEARKVNAEARAIEFQTKIKELQLALRMMKAMMIRDRSEEAIVFGEQLDALLIAIKAVSEGTASEV